MVSTVLIEESSQLMSLIEELGGDVVTDDLCIGPRCFIDMEIANLEQEPLEILADMYVGKVPIPYKVLIQYRQDLLVSQALNFKVNGVISLLPRYCQPILLKEPFMDDRFKASNLETLQLEEGLPREALRTRVAAFLESI